MSVEEIVIHDPQVIEVVDPGVGIPTELHLGGEQGPPGPPGPAGPTGVGGELICADIEITAQKLIDKQLTLPQPVFDATGFFLNIFTGILQRNTVDYLVIAGSDVLSWDGLALELLLEEGMFVQVRYIHNV